MFNPIGKINTLFWTAVIGLILTTIYSAVIVQQGIKTKKMIQYIYQYTRDKRIKDDL